MYQNKYKKHPQTHKHIHINREKEKKRDYLQFSFDNKTAQINIKIGKNIN